MCISVRTKKSEAPSMCSVRVLNSLEECSSHCGFMLITDITCVPKLKGFLQQLSAYIDCSAVSFGG